MVQTVLLLSPLQFLRRQSSLTLHSIFHISECMQHVFHDLLATMEITLSSETLFSTFSCQLVILTRSRLNNGPPSIARMIMYLLKAASVFQRSCNYLEGQKKWEWQVCNSSTHSTVCLPTQSHYLSQRI